MELTSGADRERATHAYEQMPVARSIFSHSQAGIIITPDELASMEIADLGLGEFLKTGLALVVYVNTERCCAKEIILQPGQTCPEHRHPQVDGEPGKEETFRWRWGTCDLYVEGEPAPDPVCQPPAGSEEYYTVRQEINLEPGYQYTLLPDTLHWFQAGPKGAVISEFSTRSTDENDIFTDPRIVR